MRKLFFYCALIFSAAASRLRRFCLGKNTVAILSQTDNGLIATDAEDMGVGNILRKVGSYGEDELRRVFQYIGNDDNVLVVGAHVGALVVPIARRCKSLVAIEPNPDIFKLLNINLLLNGSSNVQAHNVAASDKAEMIEFLLSRSNSGGSQRIPKSWAFEYFYDAPKTVVVQAFALDSYLKGARFSLVFMDIEGSEYFALKGMQNILGNARTLFVEYLPHALRNVGGVSPKEFVSLIEPHFDTLLIPSKNLQVHKADFLPALQTMFDEEQEDDGLIFKK